MIAVKLHSIHQILFGPFVAFLVVLKEVESNQALPIQVDPFMAELIFLGLQDVPPSRPLPHDLIAEVIKAAGGHCVGVEITRIRDNTFYAEVVLEVGGREVRVDARPSDAIALAVRVRVPILVAEAVMVRQGVLLEEEEASADDGLGPFRRFIDTLDLEGLRGPLPDDEAYAVG